MVTGITLSGLVGALVVAYFNLRPWWASQSRDLAMLAPFGRGLQLGVLTAVCPGGILGWLHAHTGPAADAGGARLTSATTGIRPVAPLAHRSLTGLNEYGAVLVVLLALTVVLAWRKANKDDKKRIAGGAFVASALCLAAGIAGALMWLPGALNSGGAGIAHAIGSVRSVL